jgi:hypothetical protein
MIEGRRYNINMIGNKRLLETLLVWFKFLIHLILTPVMVTDKASDRPLILISTLLLINVSVLASTIPASCWFLYGEISYLWMDLPNRSMG